LKIRMTLTQSVGKEGQVSVYLHSADGAVYLQTLQLFQALPTSLSTIPTNGL